MAVIDLCRILDRGEAAWSRVGRRLRLAGSHVDGPGDDGEVGHNCATVDGGGEAGAREAEAREEGRVLHGFLSFFSFSQFNCESRYYQIDAGVGASGSRKL